jgi:hypothetical protein
MRKSESKVIGGDRYTVNQLGAIEGQRVIVRLMRFFGPAIAKAQTSKGGEKDAGFIAGLADAIDPDTFEELAKTMAENTICQPAGGKPGALSAIYGEHFAGRYFELVQWFVFAMGVNFGGFFRGILAGGIASVVKPGQADPPSESPTT